MVVAMVVVVNELVFLAHLWKILFHLFPPYLRILQIAHGVVDRSHSKLDGHQIVGVRVYRVGIQLCRVIHIGTFIVTTHRSKNVSSIE